MLNVSWRDQWCGVYVYVRKSCEHDDQLKGLNQAKMHVQNKKYANFVSVSSLTGECAAQKFKTFAVLVYGHVYIIWSY